MTAPGLNIDQILDMLRKDEGLVLSVYKCPTGHKTIGYGHNMEAKPLPRDMEFTLMKTGNITKDQAEYLLDVDLSDAIADAKDLVSARTWEWLTPARRGVIVMMVFNMGKGAVAKFKDFLAALNRHDPATAASELKDSKWARQLPERAGRLIQMFLEG